MGFKVVIPARYASSRLPGKPLADIAGKPMIEHVWRRSCDAAQPSDVYVATDDERVMAAVQAFGGLGVMTAADHASGTDRIAEVAEQQGWPDETIVVNVQGDEPLMPTGLIKQVADVLADHPDAALATASHPILSAEDLENPNVVKVVTAKNGKALYFSRSTIPFDRDGDRSTVTRFPYQRHIGIYAYRVGTLKQLTNLPPAPIEELEALEQLRALYHGMEIIVAEVNDAPPAGVDTEKDLAAVRILLEQQT